MYDAYERLLILGPAQVQRLQACVFVIVQRVTSKLLSSQNDVLTCELNDSQEATASGDSTAGTYVTGLNGNQRIPCSLTIKTLNEKKLLQIELKEGAAPSV